MLRCSLTRSSLPVLFTTAALLLLTGGVSPASAQSRAGSSGPAGNSDRQAVRQAATDYVEALYRVDSMRVVRSVHPELVKYGYYAQDGAYRGTPMTHTELKQLAVSWNENQQRVDPDTATKEVVVLDVLDKTASAKVVAHWGIDYMHLAKVDGSWMIRQILWQSHPAE